MASSLACGGPKSDPPLRVFAASSLTTPLSQLAEKFKLEVPHSRLQLTFAASSILAKQIEHGGTADIYLSANPWWMDYLREKGLIQDGSRVDLLGNSLVVIASSSSNLAATDIADLIDLPFNRLALGDWTHVPAGIYAKEALEYLGLWQTIQPKCLTALNVRAALAYVEHGEADLGIVYRSDAALSRKVKILFELPDSTHSDIIYQAALTIGATVPHAQDFMRFLQSERARNIFRRDGFKIREKRD